ncbi:polycystin-2-like [Planoprotostelium fungivorum]|uniref:Polycystin-2-like n=1 Tax=Planoprotostelium fungivorum TaxID=1890364 RepID=A0A2P6NNS5_9EUKA|nr:polycystin-2-like [Planoprotostelium fungivorum]
MSVLKRGVNGYTLSVVDGKPNKVISVPVLLFTVLEDDLILAYTGSRQPLQIICLKDASVRGFLHGHESSVRALCKGYSSSCFSASDDGEVIHWSMNKMDIIHRFCVRVDANSIQSSETRLFVGSQGSILTVDLSNYTIIDRLDTLQGEPILSIRGDDLLSAFPFNGLPPNLLVWKIKDDLKLSSADYSFHTDSPICVDHDETYIYISTRKDFKIIEKRSGEERRMETYSIRERSYTSVCVYTDLLYLGHEGGADVFEIMEDGVAHFLQNLECPSASQMLASPSSDSVITCTPHDIRVYRGRRISNMMGMKDHTVSTMVTVFDCIATGGKDKKKPMADFRSLWRVCDWSLVKTLHNPDYNSPLRAVCVNRRHLVASTKTGMHIWKLSDLRARWKYKGVDGIEAICLDERDNLYHHVNVREVNEKGEFESSEIRRLSLVRRQTKRKEEGREEHSTLHLKDIFREPLQEAKAPALFGSDSVTLISDLGPMKSIYYHRNKLFIVQVGYVTIEDREKIRVAERDTQITFSDTRAWIFSQYNLIEWDISQMRSISQRRLFKMYLLCSSDGRNMYLYNGAEVERHDMMVYDSECLGKCTSIRWLRQNLRPLSSNPHLICQLLASYAPYHTFHWYTSQLQLGHGLHYRGWSTLHGSVYNKRWLFIDHWRATDPHLRVLDKDLADYIRCKAYIDDVPFFRKLVTSAIHVPWVYVSSATCFDPQHSLQCLRYLLNCISMLELRRDHNGKTLLHYAAAGAHHQAVSLLCKYPTVQKSHDKGDAALLVALNSICGEGKRIFDLDEWGDYRREGEYEMESGKVTLHMVTRSGLSECDLLEDDGRGMSVHDEILKKFHESKEKTFRGQTKEEWDDTTEMFSIMSKIVDACNARPSIARHISIFAVKHFMKSIVPHLFWTLVLALAIVGLGKSENRDGFWFRSYVQGGLQDTNWDNAIDGSSWMNWMNNTLLPFTQRDLNGTMDRSVQLHDHIAVQQSRIYFPSDRVDRDTYGPNNTWSWSSDTFSFYSPSAMVYHGGYMVKLSTDPEEAYRQLEDLVENQWIDTRTAAVSARMTLYNDAINAYVSCTFTLEFTRAGQPLRSAVIKMSRADINGVSIETLFVLAEIGCVVYLFLMIVSEGTDLYYSGTLNYISDLWNYYEILLILLFIATLALRVQWYILYKSGGNNHQLLTFTLDLSRQLSCVLLLLVLLRSLKFFEILPGWGRVVISLINTLTDQKLLVFVGLFLYVLLAFSITYFMAFSDSVEATSTMGLSILCAFKTIFGDSAFSDMISAQPIFGPIFFLLFMSFQALILMNMFIAVISDLYMSKAEDDQFKWDLNVTEIYISSKLYPRYSLWGSAQTLLTRLARWSVNRWKRHQIVPIDLESNLVRWEGGTISDKGVNPVLFERKYTNFSFTEEEARHFATEMAKERRIQSEESNTTTFSEIQTLKKQMQQLIEQNKLLVDTLVKHRTK